MHFDNKHSVLVFEERYCNHKSKKSSNRLVDRFHNVFFSHHDFCFACKRNIHLLLYLFVCYVLLPVII